MLVRFDSNVGALSMFGNAAVQLLKLMGHSGTVPSALLAQDIAQGLQRLRTALAQGVPPPPPEPTSAEDEDEKGNPRISLEQRAYPLIELLERAAKAKCDVTWRKG